MNRNQRNFLKFGNTKKSKSTTDESWKLFGDVILWKDAYRQDEGPYFGKHYFEHLASIDEHWRDKWEDFPRAALYQYPSATRIDVHVGLMGVPLGENDECKDGVIIQDASHCRWEKKDGIWYSVILSFCSDIPDEYEPATFLDVL